MNTTPHILIVEDLATDYELAQREIRRSVEQCVFERVENQKQLLESLEQYQPDVILSDYSLVAFDGMTALQLARKIAPTVPVVIWTGRMSEDVAVECMKNGATNYVLKDNLKRLGPVIQHALQERQLLLDQEEARQMIESLASFPEENPNPVLRVAQSGRILYANSAANSLLEHWATMVGQDLPGDWQQSISTCYEQGIRSSVDVFIQDQTYSIIITPVQKSGYVNLYGNNITERREAEIAIQQRNDDLTLINTLNETINRGQDLDALVKIMKQELKRIFSAEGVAIYLLGPDGKSLKMQQYYFAAGTSTKIEKVLGRAIPEIVIPIRPGGYVEEVLLARKGRIMSDPLVIQRWMAEFLETPFLPGMARGPIRKMIPKIFGLLNIRSTMLIPLVWEGKTIGLMDVSGPNLFSDNDLKRIENIAGQLTTGVQRQQTAARINELLALNEEIFDKSPLGILTYKLTGECVFANDNAASITGASVEQLRSQNFHQIESWKRSGLYDLANRAIATRSVVTEDIHHVTTFGRNVWLVVQFVTFTNNNEEHILLFIADITDRKQTEMALRESEERFRLLFENTAEAVLITRPNGTIISVNPEACRLFGRDEDEIKQIGRDGVVDRNDPRLIPALEERQRTGKFHGELNLIRKDGSIFPGELSSTVFVDSHGSLNTSMIIRDITERRKSMEESRIAKEFLQGIQNSLSSHMAILDEHGVIVQVNSAWRKFGEENHLTDVDAGIGVNYFDVCDTVTGEDAEVAGKVAAGMRSVLAEEMEEVSVEYPCHSPTEKRWFTAHITCFNDGTHKWLILAHENITQRKLMEEVLQQRTYELGERVKELRCLYNIVEIANDPSISPQDMLQGTVDLMPGGWQYPGLTCARLMLHGKTFHTANFGETSWKQSADIVSFANRVGSLDVFYLKEMPLSEEGPFLKEERLLLDTIAKWLGDITERKQAEKEIATRLSFETLLADIQSQFLQSSFEDLDKTILATQRQLCVFLGMDRSVLWQGSPERPDVLQLTNLCSLVEIPPLPEMATLNGMFPWFAKQLLAGQIVAVSDIHELPEEARVDFENLLHYGDKSTLLFPFSIGDTPIFGSLAFAATQTSEMWTESLLSQCRLITQVFSSALAKKGAEQELRESEERFRQLSTNIEELFWITDVVADKEFYMSPAVADIWGNSVEHFMLTPNAFINSILEDDKAFVLAALEKQKNGEKTSIEYRIVRADGSIHWVWDRAFPIFDDKGKVIRVAGIAADVTSRKQVEERLRSSEKQYHSLFQNLMDGFVLHEIITDDQGKPVDYRFLEVNSAFERLTGRSAEQIVGCTVNEVLPSRDNEGFISLYGRVAITGEPVHFEEYSASIGKYFKISAYSPRHGQFAVTFEDITERKLAEQELRKLSRAVEQGASSVIITDLHGSIEYVNSKFTETTGYSFEEAVGRNPRFLKTGYTSPQEYKELWNTITSGRQWQGELHNQKKNGELYWEQATISPIENENGQITNFIAVKEDITRRKQDEMEIQRHLAELEALYENGLAVGRLLEPQEIGEHVITTFARYFSWHHVAIRLLNPETNTLQVIAFNQPGLSEEARAEIVARFNTMVSKPGQGLSGWVIQTGTALRTGDVHSHPQYVDSHQGITSGLYMPLRVGNRTIGCISVESDQPDAFSIQDERLLATLANQAAIAIENARLYQASQQELDERTRAQQALWVSEIHYRQLTDSITDILFELDYNLHFTHWNKASEIFYGIPAQDATGHSMEELFGNSDNVIMRRDIYKGVLLERQSATFETELSMKGSMRFLEINAYPSTHGVSVVAKDITDRKQNEIVMEKRIELLEYSSGHSLREVMQKMIDQASALTSSHIGFLHLVEPDEATIDLQVWSTETLAHFCHTTGVETHYPSSSAGVWADALRMRQSLIHNDYASVEGKKGMPEGHAEVVREMVIPIFRNEKIVALVGIGNKEQEYAENDLKGIERFADYAWDIVERKQMETELADERNQLAKRVEERTADLSRANSNLARALHVKDEFLANMSHELRTPLNAILGLSESLSEQVAGPLNDKQHKYLSTINESGHHLLSLINDILDLAKIEAGQVTLDINKVDVNVVCQASLRMVKQLSQRKNQIVNFEIDPDFGLMWADERRLKQMIVNLLSNAVKFTPDSGSLGLEVRGDRNDNKVSISVWDQGIGINEADMHRLFKPFVQLDSGLAREATGTGLGLALVAQMAKLHGGSVTMESQIGKGSRFTIHLPWEPALAGDNLARLRTTNRFRAIRPNEVKPTILLIEDTNEVVMMLVDYLEMAGFKMVTAQDGIDGLTQAQLSHPDLILMDIQMPRLDGFETTKRLRADPEFRHTPIIALTALAMPNDRQRCLQTGMNEYLSKPVNLQALVKTIRTFLNSSEGSKT